MRPGGNAGPFVLKFSLPDPKNVMNDSKSVIVYRSEREKLWDEWYWHGGGAATVGWLAFGFIVVVGICFLFSGKNRKR